MSAADTGSAAAIADLEGIIAQATAAARNGADHGTLLRILEGRSGVPTLAQRVREAPTMGWAVVPEKGQRMLFLDRSLAEQATVQHHGTLVELIGRPVA